MDLPHHLGPMPIAIINDFNFLSFSANSHSPFSSAFSKSIENKFPEMLGYFGELFYLCAIKSPIKIISIMATPIVENTLINQKYARKCDATNVGMNEGYCWMDGEEYYATEEALITRIKKYLEESGETPILEGKSLLDWAFEEELYHFTEWGCDNMGDGYYLADGTFIEAEWRIH